MIITAIAIVKETFINAKSYVVLLWVVYMMKITKSQVWSWGNFNLWDSLDFIHIWKGHKGSQNQNKRLDQNVRGLKVFLLLIS